MSKKSTTSEFIEKAVKIHGDRYDYSLVEYKNAREKVCIICREHGEFWMAPYNHLSSKQGCPKCFGKISPSQELSEKYVLNKCNELNYTLTKPFTYKNNKTRVFLRCNKDNYEWDVTYHNFINHNRKCAKCANRPKITQEIAEHYVKNRCFEMGYDYQPFVYTSSHKTILKLKCYKDDYEWHPIYGDFIYSKRGCPKCANVVKITQEYANVKIKDKCLKYNYKLIKDFLCDKATSSRIYLKCNKDGCEWNTTYNNFINHNTCCPKCSGVNKPTKEEYEKNILKRLKESNCELTKEFIYKNLDSKIHLKCLKYNHEWITRYENFVKHETGCPMCKESKLEIEVNNFLLGLNIKFERVKRFVWLGRKSLDFYIPDYNVAIECQGEQHFVNREMFGTNKYNNIYKRDKEKFNLCIQNGVKLLYYANNSSYLPNQYHSKIYTNIKELKENIK